MGRFFMRLRQASGFFRALFFAGLAVLFGLTFVIRPAHPHFELEAAFPGFWGAFGLIGAVGMVLIMKKLVQPRIARSEDIYDR